MFFNRRRALTMVPTGGAVVLGGALLANGQEKADKGGNASELNAPKSSQAIDSAGQALDRLAGGNILEIAFYSFEFEEGNGAAWASKKQTVTPPSGWARVSVAVAGHDLHFGHEFYEEQNFAHLGVYAGVQLSGSTLEVFAHAMLRDNSGGDKWKAKVIVQAIYIG